jgi:DNA (cytosine-5)-methyltransferase 1
VAGLRNSLDDARGNLSLTFVGIANAIDHVRSVRRDDPAIIFWENVPGVLNTKDNAFGCFLGALAGENDPLIPSGDKWSNAGCVYGPQRTVAWRVLDAQYFGVAQRRRRVFVIASARNDIDPSEILFEFEGVRRDTAPSRKEGQRPTTSAEVSPRVSGGGLQGRDDCGVELSGPLSARDYKDAGTDGMNKISAKMVPVVQELVGALDTECGGNKMSHQTIASGHLLPVKSFYESSLAQYREANVSGTIKRSGGVAGGGSETFLAQPLAVYENHPADSRIKDMGEVCSTVTSRWGTGGGNMPIVSQPIPIHDQATRHAGKNGEKTMGKGNGLGIGQEGDPMNTLTKGDRHAVAQPIAFEPGKLKRLGYGDAEPGLCPALRAEAGDNQVAVAQPVVLMDQGGGVMNIQTDGIVGTLRRETHGHEPVIMQPIPIDSMNHLGRANENHSMGDFVPGAPSYTLTKGHSHAVAHQLPVCIGGEHPNAGIGIDQAPTLTSAMGTGGGHVPITDSNTQAIGIDSYNLCETGNLTQTLKSPQGGVTESIGAVRVGMAVRRLTPMECERLQGFPDGYTNIPWRKAAESPDGPRYKALGNSWAVPVVAWIGKRIDAAIKEKKNG